LLYAVHQPCGLTEPSTTWQAPAAVGVLPGIKNVQLLHFWSPFGLSWYFTAAWVAFAARALPVKADAIATTIATAPPLSSVRREIFLSRPPIIFAVPFLDMSAVIDFLT
jgi:hypothetical protein